MKVKILRKGWLEKIEVNDPKPVIDLGYRAEETIEPPITTFNEEILYVEKKDEHLVVTKNLDIKEHIVGLGEKAFHIDRRRTRVSMWNYDAYGYRLYSDPLYVSIPFFISIKNGKAVGYFVNSASRVNFDVGIKEYNKLLIDIPEESVEIYVIDGPKVQDVIEKFTEIVGRPYMLPKWALGFQVCRYSYYPQDNVIEIVKEYLKEGIKVSALYLDIDYMDNYKIFTWSAQNFPDIKNLVKQLHDTGVKIITIVDPGIRLQEDYEVFKDFLGTYVKTKDGEIYIARLWPGNCAFPDFLNKKARDKWSSWIKKWIEEYNIDGIWLDMNEPAVFTQSRTFEENAVHVLDDGRKIKHSYVHNVYAYFEAMATYEGFKSTGKEPFILSRAGFAGIQKFAANWTGDNTASDEDLRLQMVLLQSLSISGQPLVGFDIGGFIGYTNPELLVKYYKVGLFNPIFRTHKSREGNDIEVFRLPKPYKDKIKALIDIREEFLPYLYSLVYEAHKLGHPVLRPLFYEFQNDETTYYVEDEVMVGGSILYSPLTRNIYLPEGRWSTFYGKRELNGERYVEVDVVEDPVILIRYNSIIPLAHKLIIYGEKASFLIYDEREEITVTWDNNKLRFTKPYSLNEVEVRGKSFYKAIVNGEIQYNVQQEKSGIVTLKGLESRKIHEIEFS